MNEYEASFVYLAINKFNNKNINLVIEMKDYEDALVKIFISKQDATFALSGINWNNLDLCKAEFISIQCQSDWKFSNSYIIIPAFSRFEIKNYSIISNDSKKEYRIWNDCKYMKTPIRFIPNTNSILYININHLYITGVTPCRLNSF